MGAVIPFSSGQICIAECGCGCREWILELDPTQPGIVVGTICAAEDCGAFVPLLGHVVDMAKEH